MCTHSKQVTLTLHQSELFCLFACICIRWICASTSQWMGWLPTPTLTQTVQSITSVTALARTWVWLITLSRSHLLGKARGLNVRDLTDFFHYELNKVEILQKTFKMIYFLLNLVLNWVYLHLFQHKLDKVGKRGLEREYGEKYILSKMWEQKIEQTEGEKDLKKNMKLKANHSMNRLKWRGKRNVKRERKDNLSPWCNTEKKITLILHFTICFIVDVSTLALCFQISQITYRNPRLWFNYRAVRG